LRISTPTANPAQLYESQITTYLRELARAKRGQFYIVIDYTAKRTVAQQLRVICDYVTQRPQQPRTSGERSKGDGSPEALIRKRESEVGCLYLNPGTVGEEGRLIYFLKKISKIITPDQG